DTIINAATNKDKAKFSLAYDLSGDLTFAVTDLKVNVSQVIRNAIATILATMETADGSKLEPGDALTIVNAISGEVTLGLSNTSGIFFQEATINLNAAGVKDALLKFVPEGEVKSAWRDIINAATNKDKAKFSLGYDLTGDLTFAVTDLKVNISQIRNALATILAAKETANGEKLKPSDAQKLANALSGEATLALSSTGGFILDDVKIDFAAAGIIDILTSFLVDYYPGFHFSWSFSIFGMHFSFEFDILERGGETKDNLTAILNAAVNLDDARITISQTDTEVVLNLSGLEVSIEEKVFLLRDGSTERITAGTYDILINFSEATCTYFQHGKFVFVTTFTNEEIIHEVIIDSSHPLYQELLGALDEAGEDGNWLSYRDTKYLHDRATGLYLDWENTHSEGDNPYAEAYAIAQEISSCSNLEETGDGKYVFRYTTTATFNPGDVIQYTGQVTFNADTENNGFIINAGTYDTLTDLVSGEITYLQNDEVKYVAALVDFTHTREEEDGTTTTEFFGAGDIIQGVGTATFAENTIFSAGDSEYTAEAGTYTTWTDLREATRTYFQNNEMVFMTTLIDRTVERVKIDERIELLREALIEAGGDAEDINSLDLRFLITLGLGSPDGSVAKNLASELFSYDYLRVRRITFNAGDVIGYAGQETFQEDTVFGAGRVWGDESRREYTVEAGTYVTWTDLLKATCTYSQNNERAFAVSLIYRQVEQDFAAEGIRQALSWNHEASCSYGYTTEQLANMSEEELLILWREIKGEDVPVPTAKRSVLFFAGDVISYAGKRTFAGDTIFSAGDGEEYIAKAGTYDTWTDLLEGTRTYSQNNEVSFVVSLVFQQVQQMVPDYQAICEQLLSNPDYGCTAEQLANLSREDLVNLWREKKGRDAVVPTQRKIVVFLEGDVIGYVGKATFEENTIFGAGDSEYTAEAGTYDTWTDLLGGTRTYSQNNERVFLVTLIGGLATEGEGETTGDETEIIVVPFNPMDVIGYAGEETFNADTERNGYLIEEGTYNTWFDLVSGDVTYSQGGEDIFAVTKDEKIKTVDVKTLPMSYDCASGTIEQKTTTYWQEDIDDDGVLDNCSNVEIERFNANGRLIYSYDESTQEELTYSYQEKYDWVNCQWTLEVWRDDGDEVEHEVRDLITNDLLSTCTLDDSYNAGITYYFTYQDLANGMREVTKTWTEDGTEYSSSEIKDALGRTQFETNKDGESFVYLHRKNINGDIITYIYPADYQERLDAAEAELVRATWAYYDTLDTYDQEFEYGCDADDCQDSFMTSCGHDPYFFSNDARMIGDAEADVWYARYELEQAQDGYIRREINHNTGLINEEFNYGNTSYYNQEGYPVY
ncbi:MAG: hypothetical protein ABID54_10575, partial [Pseudomonadota bacterium]